MRIAIAVSAMCILATGLSVGSNVEASICKSVSIPPE